MPHFNPQWLNRPHKRDNPERRLQVQCCIYLYSLGWISGIVKNIGSPNKFGGHILDRYQMRGTPDIIAFSPDKKVMLAIEAKIKNNPQSDFQKMWQENFHLPPSRIYAIIRSRQELEDVIKGLTK